MDFGDLLENPLRKAEVKQLRFEFSWEMNSAPLYAKGSCIKILYSNQHFFDYLIINLLEIKSK